MMRYAFTLLVILAVFVLLIGVLAMLFVPPMPFPGTWVTAPLERDGNTVRYCGTDLQWQLYKGVLYHYRSSGKYVVLTNQRFFDGCVRWDIPKEYLSLVWENPSVDFKWPYGLPYPPGASPGTSSR